MTPETPQPAAATGSLQLKSAAGRIVLVYAVFACLWILLSDRVVLALFSDPTQIAFVSTLKGWLFVAVTSLLLFGLIQRLLSQLLSAAERERQAQSERSKTQQLLEAIVHSSSDAIFVKDLEGRYLLFNQETARVTNKSTDQALGMDDRQLFPMAQAEKIRANDQRVIALNRITSYEERLSTVDGERVFLATKGPLRDANGKVFGLFGISRDITERKQSEEALRIAATAFESQLGMIITSADQVILQVNKAFTEITGYSPSEAVGQRPSMFSSGRHDRAFYAALWNSIARTGSWQGEIWNRRKSGEVYPEWLTVTAVKDEAGRATHFVATFSDITPRKTAENEIENLAFYDPLTSLPNRRLLLDRLEQALAAGSRHKRNGALLFVDLDNFKTLNDTLGHDKGDLLLVQVARRLSTCIREGDTVARLGGDEFVVMLESLSEEALEAATQAETVGTKILHILSQTYELAGHEHHSTASVGITLFGDHQETVDGPLKRADLAMYQAKAAGRNAMRFFDPQMQAVVSARATLEADLRLALTQGQFILHYQPQVGLDRQLTGAEALVRWQHPLRGRVGPAEFIPLAEESGLILALGQWVLETACQQLAHWAGQASLAQLTVAVNVSARQFHQSDFADQVLDTLARSGANPSRLKLELTESLLVTNVEDVITKMSVLQAAGVGFSLDDFGTGYSSLAYLKRMPLDQLKIDQGLFATS
jgi:diguanylate cyclase (GGDEF)-like protein/PAS domain S-box-containing protein